MNYDVSTTWKLLLTFAIMWEVVWKGIALWRASKNNHRGWFVALLLISSLGVLPIIYVLTHKSSDEG